jgi:hypothetical protein
MKKQTGIWIDTSKAIIVTFTDGKEHTTEIESDIENRIYHEKEGDKGAIMGSHHLNSERTFDERKEHQFDHFLNDVLSHIKESDELYVFGPSETKIKLKQKIDDGKTIADNKLKSVETADSMTLNQVVAKVKKFYNL